MSLEAQLAALLSSAACDSGEVGDAAEYDGDYAEEEEEELVEITEQEALRHLDALNPPLEVCGRLFFDPAPSAELQVLPRAALSALRTAGYTMLDGLFLPSAAAALRADALRLYDDGAFSRPPSHEGFTDITARGDEILWVHPASELVTGAPGLASAASLLLALRDDVGSFLALRRGQVRPTFCGKRLIGPCTLGSCAPQAELQLAVYPAGSAAHYKRHRDAFPDDGSAEDQRRVTAVLCACRGGKGRPCSRPSPRFSCAQTRRSPTGTSRGRAVASGCSPPERGGTTPVKSSPRCPAASSSSSRVGVPSYALGSRQSAGRRLRVPLTPSRRPLSPRLQALSTTRCCPA